MPRFPLDLQETGQDFVAVLSRARNRSPVALSFLLHVIRLRNGTHLMSPFIGSTLTLVISFPRYVCTRHVSKTRHFVGKFCVIFRFLPIRWDSLTGSRSPFPHVTVTWNCHQVLGLSRAFLPVNISSLTSAVTPGIWIFPECCTFSTRWHAELPINPRSTVRVFLLAAWICSYSSLSTNESGVRVKFPWKRERNKTFGVFEPQLGGRTCLKCCVRSCGYREISLKWWVVLERALKG